LSSNCTSRECPWMLVPVVTTYMRCSKQKRHVRDLRSVIGSWLILDVATQRLALLMQNSEAIDPDWQSKSTFLVPALGDLSRTYPFITGALFITSAPSLMIMIHSSQPRSWRSKSP
jgi:hypothetical protein